MQFNLPLPGAKCAYPRRPGLRERLNRPLHFPLKLWGETLTRHPVEFMLFSTLGVLLLGATAFWLAERGSAHSTLHSWWDGLWLTVTSVDENYGDVHPVTSGGRAIAVLVAISGALLIGSFTAVITNYLLGDDHREVVRALHDLNDRLERIEAKLERRDRPE
jgi:hypothetical protein